MRPMWYQYPQEQGFNMIEDQYMFGSSLLVKPVLQNGTERYDLIP